MDSPGEIGTINQGDAEKVLRYKEIRQVDPVGTFKLSASRNEFKGEIPEMGGVHGRGQAGIEISRKELLIWIYIKALLKGDKN